jgi:hypothetical protein
MITYKDIKKAINETLTNEFQIEINSKDIQEGFNRPSFFVSFDNQVSSSTTNEFEKSLTIRINYFPSDRYDYSLELLEVQDRLEKIFDLKLKVLDRKFNIHETSTIETDGVLEFSFDIQFSYGKEISDALLDEDGTPVSDGEGNPIKIEPMQTLDIKKG